MSMNSISFRGARGIKGQLVLSLVAIVTIVSVIWSIAANAITPTVEIASRDGDLYLTAGESIVLTFDEAIYADDSQNAFAISEGVSAISGIASVTRQTDESSLEINGTWGMNAEATVATFTPGESLFDGAESVTVSVTNGYYNAEGEQGTAGSETFVVDTAGPTIAIASPAPTSSAQEKTLSAAITDSNEKTDGYRYSITTQSTCDSAVIADNTGGTAYTSGATITLDNEDQNSSYVCFRAQDLAGNVSFSRSEQVQGIDTTAPSQPTVTTTDEIDGNIIVTFGEMVYHEDKTEITASAFTGEESIFALEEVLFDGDDYLAVTGYAATKEGNVVTIDPSDDLKAGTAYRVTVADGYYDAAGNQGSSVQQEFTTAEEESTVTDETTDDNDQTTNTDEETETETDTTPPVITLNGDNPTTITQGSAYTEPGAIADGSEEITITGTVNTQEPGTYTITYSATDEAGNTATIERQVIVVQETTAPMLSSPSSIGTTNDTTPDFTFTTDEAGTITYTGSCSSTTTAATVGASTVTFSDLAEGTYADCAVTVTDTNSNISSALAVPDFTIDTTPPSAPTINLPAAVADGNIFIVFSETVYLSDAMTEIDETNAGDIVTLKEVGTDTEVSHAITKSGNTFTVDPDNALTADTEYEISVGSEYYDSAGNRGSEATATFSITAAEETGDEILPDEVIGEETDTTPPVITLNGDNPTTITQGSAYTEPGATADGSEEITITGTVNTQEPGTYTITYSATDEDGNTATAERQVIVVQETTAPMLSSPSSIGTTNDTTPDFTFTTDEAGTITYTGSCSSTTTAATVGANTVTFATLVDGTYSDCAVVVTDEAANASQPLSVPTFTVDTTSPSQPTVAGTEEVDGNITITFGEMVYLEDGTEVDAGNFKGEESMFVLEEEQFGGDSYTGISDYTVTKNGNVFTIDPTDDLKTGTTYRVKVADDYYDAVGNQGSEVAATFSTATEEENTATEEDEDVVVTFSPTEDAVITDLETNITVTFDEAVYKNADGDAFTESDLATFVSLRTEDENGYGITSSVSMNESNTVITIDPTDKLPAGDIYVAISADYYTADGTRGESKSVIFNVNVRDFFVNFFTQLFTEIFPQGGSNTPTITQTYTFGDFDVNIKLAQVLLDKSDCPASAVGSESLLVVGYLDILTEEAIACYQESKGLEATGSLTPETFDSLVENHYQGELNLPGFSLITDVGEEVFNQSVLNQAFYLLQRAFATLGFADLVGEITETDDTGDNSGESGTDDTGDSGSGETGSSDGETGSE